MKKIFSIILVSLILFIVPAQAEYFPDVPDSHISQASINYLYELGVVDGYPDGTFGPNKTLNRAEFAKMVVMVEDGETPQKPKMPCFADVSINSWYAPYVCRAKDLGFMKGDNGGGTVFKPERTLNMAEILAVMARQYEWNFAKQKSGEMWYAPYVAVADEMNIISGRFDPASFVQRKSFSDVMARSLVVYDLAAEKFESDTMYAEDLSYDTITAYDCADGEKFDETQQTCVIDCSINPTACAQQVVDVAEVEAQVEDPANKIEEGISTNVLAGYTIENNVLVEDMSFRKSQTNLAKINTVENRQKIWNLFTSLIPEEQRKDIGEFYINSDGEGNILASVEISAKNPKKWAMYVDIADSFAADGTMNTLDLEQTLIHEFTHVMTLRQGQLRILGDGDTSTSDCPTYDPGEGCALESAYIAKYYDKFWKDIAPAHPMSKEFASETEFEDAVYAFYQKYASNYVSDYAATNPAEDMAETFTHFVVNDKPVGKTIADQKVLFFWDYPELLALRTYIRNKL